MAKKKGELKEKDFIHNPQDPFPLWGSVLGFLVLVLLIYGCGYWAQRAIEKKREASPVHEITNRDYLLFIGQNPDYIPSQAQQDQGYFSDYLVSEDITLPVSRAENLAALPPDVLRRYYAWYGFVREYDLQRPIPAVEYREFLAQRPEWQPENWRDAPEEYQGLVEDLVENQDDVADLPHKARLAFFGWKNTLHEHEEIQRYQPTYQDLEELLEMYPRYGPEYWAIHLYPTTPRYLRTYSDGAYQLHEPIAEVERAPFLHQALYNYKRAQEATPSPASTP